MDPGHDMDLYRGCFSHLSELVFAVFLHRRPFTHHTRVEADVQRIRKPYENKEVHQQLELDKFLDVFVKESLDNFSHQQDPLRKSIYHVAFIALDQSLVGRRSPFDAKPPNLKGQGLWSVPIVLIASLI